MLDIDGLTEMLASPSPSVRRDACESIRGAPSLPPDAIAALERATNDLDPSVRDAATRALAIHKPSFKPSSEPSDRVVSATTRGRRARGLVLILVGLALSAPSLIPLTADPQALMFTTLSGGVVLLFYVIPAFGVVLAVSGLGLVLFDWLSARH